MCGIVAVVSRPAGGPTPAPPTRSWPPLDAAVARGAAAGRVAGRRVGGRPPRRAGRPAAAGRARACRRWSAARAARRRRWPRLDVLDAPRRPRSSADLEAARRPTPTLEERQRRPGRAPRRAVGAPPRPAAHRRRRRRPRRPRRRRRRRSPPSPPCRWRCRPSTASRCAAATRPACTCSCGTTASTSTSRAGAPRCSRRATATRCSRRARSGSRRTARSSSSTRRPPRSASWATTPRALRAALRDDGLLRLALAAPTRPRHRARPHPLGERRHHLRAQRPSRSTRRRRAAGDGPYVAAALNGDVDNHADLKAAHGLRIPAPITTDAKVIPALVVAPGRRRPATSPRRSAARSPRFEGSVAIARGVGRRARPTVAGPAGQRPGALRRPGRGRVHRRQRAVRARRGDRHVRAHRRRDAGAARTSPAQPRPGRRARRRRGRDARAASGGSPTTARELPVDDDDVVHGRDHHPRHRPGRRTRTSC